MKDVVFVNATLENKLYSRINGTMILATKLIQAGFSVDVVHFFQIESYDRGDYHQFIEDITGKILAEQPRCVSFYAFWSSYHIMLRISKRLKEIDPSIIVVMGGPQASATAYETMKAMDSVDYIATGEGENTVVPLFESLVRNNCEGADKIPGVYYRRNGEVDFCHEPIKLCDLNTVPHWDDSLCVTDETNFDSDGYFMPIDVGRGCPFHCSFCSTCLFWKRAYRLKSPERILEDIRYYNQKYGIKSFLFSHDALTANEKLMTEVCDRIIESGLKIKWVCTTRADIISKELILKMKAAGLCHIEVGVETGSPRMQQIINKKLNLEKVKETVKFLVANRIKTTLYFMYGFPEETEEDLNQTINLHSDFLEMGIKNSAVLFCKFIPSADITRQHLDELVFDPQVKVLSKKVFGYYEEIDMFKNNKAIFSAFHHLNTPVRNNYQYLVYFLAMHRTFRKTLPFLRAYYQNDLLKFYRDFHNNNLEIFDSDMSVIKENFAVNQRQILLNTFKHFPQPLRERFSALVEYEADFRTVADANGDMRLQKTYAFNYIEYQMRLPIDQFSDTQTELLIEKKNGRVDVQILHI